MQAPHAAPTPALSAYALGSARTVASALDETMHAGGPAGGPAGPKWDLAVRTEGSRFPQARIVAQSGTSFCMSGAVMKNRGVYTTPVKSAGFKLEIKSDNDASVKGSPPILS